MINITLKQIKKLQLDMLLYIKEVCDENHLRFYLAYGTLLGAVRHGGYIPWDDDIDIMMPRKDYEKLIEIEKQKHNSVYKIVSYETEDNYTLPFPKMIDTRTILRQSYHLNEKVELGIYIDIFLLDGAGNTVQEVKKKREESISLIKKWYRSVMVYDLEKNNQIIYLARWLKNYVYRKRGVRYYLSEQKRCNSKIAFDTSKFVGVLCYNKNLKQENIWASEVFKYGKKLMFENTEYSVPYGYEEILKSIYKDYMQLPPKEERVSDHVYEAFWRV